MYPNVRDIVAIIESFRYVETCVCKHLREASVNLAFHSSSGFCHLLVSMKYEKRSDNESDDGKVGEARMKYVEA